MAKQIKGFPSWNRGERRRIRQYSESTSESDDGQADQGLSLVEPSSSGSENGDADGAQGGTDSPPVSPLSPSNKRKRENPPEDGESQDAGARLAASDGAEALATRARTEVSGPPPEAQPLSHKEASKDETEYTIAMDTGTDTTGKVTDSAPPSIADPATDAGEGARTDMATEGGDSARSTAAQDTELDDCGEDDGHWC